MFESGILRLPQGAPALAMSYLSVHCWHISCRPGESIACGGVASPPSRESARGKPAQGVRRLRQSLLFRSHLRRKPFP